MQRKIILFDFDGTIADTILLPIFNRLAGDYGYKTIRLRDIAALRNKPTDEFFRMLGISRFALPLIARRIRREMGKDMRHAKPKKGIRSVLKRLNRRGYAVGIVTSNAASTVRTFLRTHELHADFIFSGSSIFGKGAVLKRLMEQHEGIILYVGDETRDIDAARKARVKIAAVSWGFASRTLLAKQKPDFLINSPHELLGLLK